MQSWKLHRFRLNWKIVHGIKVFLNEKGQLKEPEGTEPFYHIPALENGLMTLGQLRAFLRQNGWEEWTTGLPTFE